jgi:dipeptidyl aminopeptidase/acylaminoacyl peptidase
MRDLASTLGRVLGASALLACGDTPTGPGRTPPSIEVTATTTGEPVLLEGYTLSLDGGVERSIGVNGLAVFDSVAPGAHEVRLLGAPTSCVVAGANPRSVTVTVGVAEVHFDVDCRSTGGTLVVETATQGPRPDPDGYRILVSGYPAESIGSNASLVLTDVPPGPLTVTLGDVSPNCTPDGPNPRTVTVEDGETTRARFEVLCVAGGAGVILFDSDRTGESHTYRVAEDGSGLLDLTPSTEACCGDWSPDGTRVAFTAPEGIVIMDQDGARPTALHVDGGEPRWSPDGLRLVFTSGATFISDGTIYVMGVDGSAPVTIGTGRSPDWSPDGSRLAFWRRGQCVSDICSADVFLMNADGSDVRRLTRSSGFGEAYTHPAWSPDGSRIAYRRQAFLGGDGLELIRPDGSDRQALGGTAGSGRPVWSPDGSTLAFAARTADGEGTELTLIPVTGGGTTVLASSPGREYPQAWK